jgi:hypothetical protein
MTKIQVVVKVGTQLFENILTIDCKVSTEFLITFINNLKVLIR